MTAKIMELEAKPNINHPNKDAQTLETLGLLTGGIAHDFNNLLTSIISQTSIALAMLPPESKARQHVEKSLQSAEAAAALTQQLLNYAKNIDTQPETLRVNQFIRDNLILLNMFVLNGSTIQLDFSPGLAPIKTRKAHIQQILMNLVLNAAEALRGKEDTITIKTGREFLTGTEKIITANGRNLPPGEYLTIQVIDTGRGMDQTTLRQIFQPFFTTKRHGRGLGLSTILELVTQENGGIQVNSQLERGTTFTIYLPKYLRNPMPWT